MKKRYSITLLLITVLLISGIFIGSSYSLWSSNSSQTGYNEINVSCLSVSIMDSVFSDNGDIILSNEYPIEETAGKEKTPYRFRIENICSSAANYQVNLETLNTNEFNLDYLRVLFNDAENSVIYSNGLEDTIPRLNDATVAKKLVSGYLAPRGSENSSVDYNLRLWIDYDATVETENVMGKEWHGKLSAYSEATDELNPIESNQRLTNYLWDLPNSETVVQDDGTVDKNMRFIGENPNNYLTFNDETAGWRIIGIFNGNSHGKDGQLVKIIRNTNLGLYSWDYSSSYNYDNNWSASQLMTMLNDGYFNSLSSYTYYNSGGYGTQVNFSESGIKESTKDLIQNATWKNGTTALSDSRSNDGTFNLYNGERSKNTSSATDYSTEWNNPGYIALPYMSDFLLATSGYGNVSRSLCLAKQPGMASGTNTFWKNASSNSSKGPCSRGSWLIKTVSDSSNYTWTLSTSTSNSSVYSVLYNSETGIVYSDVSSNKRIVYPVLYLKANVTCTNCDEEDVGTQTNPFEITIS